MAGRLANSVAVVTGAARGIGRSIAERLADEGARVACLDVSARRIQTACEEMQAAGRDVRPYVLDAARREDVHSTMRRIAEARDAGVNEILAKPVTVRGVLSRISEVIENPRPFVRTPDYFGPERRRRADPNYTGKMRRAADRLRPPTMIED